MSEEITLNISGWINVPKSELKLAKRGSQVDGSLKEVSPDEFTVKQLIEAINEGSIYIRFTAMMDAGLCTENEFEFDIDDMEIL